MRNGRMNEWRSKSLGKFASVGTFDVTFALLFLTQYIFPIIADSRVFSSLPLQERIVVCPFSVF